MVHKVVGTRRVIGWILVGLPAGFLSYDILWFVGHYVYGYFADQGVDRTLLVLALEALASTVPIGIGVLLLVRVGHPTPRTEHVRHLLRRITGWALVVVPSAYAIRHTGLEAVLVTSLIVSGVLVLRPRFRPPDESEQDQASDSSGEPEQDQASDSSGEPEPGEDEAGRRLVAH